jgi:hypothetical protein
VCGLCAAAFSSIRGQQFIIEECENCTIYLLDYSATVSIDECRNCRIFVGPCESSVFVRTSKKLKLVIAAQQLRSVTAHNYQPHPTSLLVTGSSLACSACWTGVQHS